MRWAWIDQIVEFEPERRMVAIKGVTRGEDQLASQILGGEARAVMPASLMIEGMAQTAGILVGTVNQFREKVVLAKIISATFNADVFPGQTIRYTATLERMDARGGATKGTVERLVHPEGEWEAIGKVKLMFAHIDQNVSGLEFPEDNFVFSGLLEIILRESGLAELVPG